MMVNRLKSGEVENIMFLHRGQEVYGQRDLLQVPAELFQGEGQQLSAAWQCRACGSVSVDGGME